MKTKPMTTDECLEWLWERSNSLSIIRIREGWNPGGFFPCTGKIHSVWAATANEALNKLIAEVKEDHLTPPRY